MRNSVVIVILSINRRRKTWEEEREGRNSSIERKIEKERKNM